MDKYKEDINFIEDNFRNLKVGVFGQLLISFYPKEGRGYKIEVIKDNGIPGKNERTLIPVFICCEASKSTVTDFCEIEGDWIHDIAELCRKDKYYHALRKGEEILGDYKPLFE